jgi:hypothetical protein
LFVIDRRRISGRVPTANGGSDGALDEGRFDGREQVSDFGIRFVLQN